MIARSVRPTPTAFASRQKRAKVRFIERFEIDLGLRFVRAKRRDGFISFISLVSMVGIALGVATLIVVLSVMNGFEFELRERMLAATAHVDARGDAGPIEDWRALLSRLQANPQVKAVAPYVSVGGVLRNGEQERASLVRGIDPTLESAVNDTAKFAKQGALAELKAGAWGVILGVDLAKSLNVKVGDGVTLIAPSAFMVTPIGSLPRWRRLTVIGIFEFGLAEIDSRVALVHMEDAQRLFQLGSGISGVRARLHDLNQAPSVAQAWLAASTTLAVTDWTRANANVFKAIATQKRAMFVILVLIVAVAAFNLVSTLIMIVTDKQSDIAILRTMGATPLSIMQVFLLQGAVIGFVGAIAGLALGLLIALNVSRIAATFERIFNVALLERSVYPIPDLPSRVMASDVIAIVAVSLLLSLAATLYPSWRASRVSPADALRYE
jgi:lipoprotein-releasing system permease protein